MVHFLKYLLLSTNITSDYKISDIHFTLDLTETVVKNLHTNKAMKSGNEINVYMLFSTDLFQAGHAPLKVNHTLMSLLNRDSQMDIVYLQQSFQLCIA